MAQQHSPTIASCGVPSDLNHEFTKGFAGRYIRYRAWKLAGTCGISRSDREDIEQDLRIALLERIEKFDSQRGHWNVFALTIVERAIAKMFTARRVTQRTLEYGFESLATLIAAEDGQESMLAQLVTPDEQSRVNGRAVRHHEDEWDRQDDVSTMLAELSPALREIAQRLKTTSPTTLAREMGISRRTLRTWMNTIRETFESGGYGSRLGNHRPADNCGIPPRREEFSKLLEISTPLRPKKR